MMQVPIPTVHLFPRLDGKLIELLRSLSPEDWSRPTVAKLWTVKDVATHLLDGNIRMISMIRDNYFGESSDKIDSYRDLVNFLDQLNADWVKATKRMSPPVLIELLEVTGKEYAECIARLDPYQPAIFSVAWAGEEQSLNWFHIAREYTEKWHHQQQIRDAVKKPGIMTKEFYYPLIDTFMQALPHTYRNIKANGCKVVEVIVSSEIGGIWYLTATDNSWLLTKIRPADVDATVTIDPDTAWKLFTKAVTSDEAEKRVIFQGDKSLGKPILTMLSVMG